MEVIQKTYISRMTKWANEMERALHALTGEGGFYPPYSFPSIIRGYKTKPVVVPDKKDVSPELLSDIQAVIDECNTAITETFSDAPEKFSANDMPGIFLSHVLTCAWTLLYSGDYNVTKGDLITSQTPGVTIPYSGYVVYVSSIALDDKTTGGTTHVGGWYPDSSMSFHETGKTVISWYRVTI